MRPLLPSIVIHTLTNVYCNGITRCSQKYLFIGNPSNILLLFSLCKSAAQKWERARTVMFLNSEHSKQYLDSPTASELADVLDNVASPAASPNAAWKLVNVLTSGNQSMLNLAATAVGELAAQGLPNTNPLTKIL